MARSNSTGAVSIATAPARPTAVIPAATTWAEFPRTWRPLLDTVHAGMRWGGTGRKGRNVMLYLDDLPHVEIGVELDQPATFEPPIVRSTLPGGVVATTVHRGDYGRLGVAHHRVVSWVRDQGLTLCGPRWEVYGHWHEDPEQLLTEIYYLLG